LTELSYQKKTLIEIEGVVLSQQRNVKGYDYKTAVYSVPTKILVDYAACKTYQFNNYGKKRFATTNIKYIAFYFNNYNYSSKTSNTEITYKF